MRCAECDCENGGAECNWIVTPPRQMPDMTPRTEDLDTAQLRNVLTYIVETGDVWALLPKGVRNDAMAQFLKLPE